jgi:hypothetical protein
MITETWRLQTALTASAALVTLVLSGPAAAQQVELPEGIIGLEGLPTLRIDSTEEGTVRRALDSAEAAEHRLQVHVRDGAFYWTSRDGDRLRLDRSGEFTYLMADPGRYIKVTRLDDRLTYVEHLETKPFGSITWWGELRIVLRP